MIGYGIAHQALLALRAEPNHRAEMVNQLLFGERFSILEQQGEWCRVQAHHDKYTGWAERQGFTGIDPTDYANQLDTQAVTVASRLFIAHRQGDAHPIRLCPGSLLRAFDIRRGTFRILGHRYTAISWPLAPPLLTDRLTLVDRAQAFINSPYLWGGRSPYGIDCSGLTQVLLSTIGRQIPRDASQQAAMGATVRSVAKAKPGDLAFFGNPDGPITHVGIVLGKGRIIHSSGCVRIDKLDNQGIYREPLQGYTHALRAIKNLIDPLT